MNAIVGIVEVLLDALFPPRASELVIRTLSSRAYEQLLKPITRNSVDALLPYDHPDVSALIWELKYYDSEKAVGICADLLATHIGELLAEELTDSPVLVAIPLHKSRLRERGYNQSERLAHATAKKLGRAVAYAPSLLVRVRATPRQTDLPRHKRLENVRGAFSIARPQVLQGRTCILIDDVLTTGSTLTEAARVLRSTGALRVFAIALSYAE